ncbi:hypothetical protein SmJEL517_g05703 [Synchytrium microbalum]|uniref:Flap endonuclease 1 n=1 Tax=Synchytrium microbalum TaxID=1806994 RepID=A0A507BZS2_9FUNG|nr:uncharacterized protein SmJEL517_g05703 [Synchytrium microbalum]TPX30835.1 hypothetical protein SmJEL517_g05703 [Synchytrium microbalum]
MGIQGLTKVIADHAPEAMTEHDIKNYFGRKVAIDASMSIYQFLIAVRSDGQQLTNEAGETTSHLMGIFYRTLRMIEHGIKPCYVFDGKPPVAKSAELKKRGEKRAEALEEMKKAEETGDTETFDKFSRRTVKVTKEHNEECKRLLKLMGVPYVDAPCEAEAQCAALAKAGKVYAAASEDMDTLTFGAPVLLRHLTFSEARKMNISEIHLDKALEGMKMSMEQFTDLCILLGCDYCDSIKGVGPHRAMELMQKYKNLDDAIKHLDKKFTVPEDWPYEQARSLFVEPEVQDPNEIDLKWEDPDVDGIIAFMVEEKNFNEDRIRNAVAKLVKNRGTATQGRLDGFFKPLPKDPNAATPAKRKNDASSSGKNSKAKTDAKGKDAKAKGKGGAGKPRK